MNDTRDLEQRGENLPLFSSGQISRRKMIDSRSVSLLSRDPVNRRLEWIVSSITVLWQEFTSRRSHSSRASSRKTIARSSRMGIFLRGIKIELHVRATCGKRLEMKHRGIQLRAMSSSVTSVRREQLVFHRNGCIISWNNRRYSDTITQAAQ